MENLPYVTAALICERVMEEKDGVLSAIRIVDRAEVQIQGDQPGLANIVPAFQLACLVCLKSGPAKGQGALTIDGVKPSGETKRLAEFPLDLKGGDSGQNLVINMTIASKEEGLHWFDVRFDGQLLSKIPLILVRIVKQAETAVKTIESPKMS